MRHAAAARTATSVWIIALRFTWCSSDRWRTGGSCVRDAPVCVGEIPHAGNAGDEVGRAVVGMVIMLGTMPSRVGAVEEISSNGCRRQDGEVVPADLHQGMHRIGPCLESGHAVAEWIGVLGGEHRLAVDAQR